MFGRARPDAAFVRLCNLHLPLRGDGFLVAATLNHDGLFAEQVGGVEGGLAADPGALGALVVRKLSECRQEKAFNYAGAKRSDWPAFRESGLKTVKAFEERYSRYTVEGANAANVTWRVSCAPLPNDAVVTSLCAAGASPARIGAWLLEFHRFHLEIRGKVFGG